MVTDERYDSVLGQSVLVKGCQNSAKLCIGIAHGGRVSLTQLKLHKKEVDGWC